VGDLVGRCASLAALLEVSAYPKPGNVHRLRDFPGTSYEHFLAGAVSTMPWMRELADRSNEMKDARRDWGSLGIGESILGAVRDMLTWQRGGNVHLGVILLFAPIAAAAGAVAEGGRVDPIRLTASIREIVGAATPRDAVAIYRAISLAMSKENLGEVDELDVADPASLVYILEKGVTPLDVFSICAERDSVCSEWVTGFTVVVSEGYPCLADQLRRGLNVNDSVVNTFLRLLSTHPDSLIRRKRGPEAALAVSERAKGVLDAGGAASDHGRRMLIELDEELQRTNGALNPGTTADLTAASLFVLLLTGWRP